MTRSEVKQDPEVPSMPDEENLLKSKGFHKSGMNEWSKALMSGGTLRVYLFPAAQPPDWRLVIRSLSNEVKSERGYGKYDLDQTLSFYL